MIKETDGDEFEDMRSLNQELTFEVAKKAFNCRGLAFQSAQMRTLGLLNEENYGGLAGGVTLEDVLYGLSICRNRKLANVFYRLNLIEAYGTGLQKIRNAYAGTGGKPEFMAGPSSFKVILPNMNKLKSGHVSENIESVNDEKMEQIIHFIETQGEASRKEIENYLGISTSTAVRLMIKLSNSGLIRIVGKGKNVRYTVK